MGSAWPKIGGAAFNGLVSGISSQITQDLQKPHKHGKDKEENQKKTPEKDEEVLHNGSPMHASDVPPDRVVHNGIGEMVQLANVTVTSLGIEDVEVVKAGDLLRVASAATNSAAASEMSEPDGADQSSNAVDILSILAITENSDDRENVTLAHLSNDTNFTALNASGVQTLRTRSSQAILIPSGEMQGVHGATSQSTVSCLIMGIFAVLLVAGFALKVVVLRFRRQKRRHAFRGNDACNVKMTAFQDDEESGPRGESAVSLE